MTSFLSEWKHIATTKLETKHSELIVMAQPVELLSEWKHKVPVKLEKKHFEPIAMALPVEVTRQQCSGVIPNP
jgi:hypothetical protein